MNKTLHLWGHLCVPCLPSLVRLFFQDFQLRWFGIPLILYTIIKQRLGFGKIRSGSVRSPDGFLIPRLELAPVKELKKGNAQNDSESSNFVKLEKRCSTELVVNAVLTL